VEDTENTRVLLERRLKLKRYDVLTVPDAESGLAAAQSQQPDLILMDVGLPGLDGWEATRRLKADPATNGIPVIALTAHAMQGDREKALQAGCDNYETKPIDFEGLFAKMDSLLGAKAARPGV